jgi:hypothetical protein
MSLADFFIRVLFSAVCASVDRTIRNRLREFESLKSSWILLVPPALPLSKGRIKDLLLEIMFLLVFSELFCPFFLSFHRQEFNCRHSLKI